MPIVIRSAGLTDWERTFCASCISKAQRGSWWPSAKQAVLMRRMVDAFREHHRDEPVIERADQ